MTGDSKADAIARARLNKANRIVAALRSAGAASADLDLPDFPWDDAVAAARVRPPSDETKALVRETLLFLESVPVPADPFDGLI